MRMKYEHPLPMSGKDTLDNDLTQPFCLTDEMNDFTQHPS
jgi:hypothetical protein